MERKLHDLLNFAIYIIDYQYIQHNEKLTNVQSFTLQILMTDLVENPTNTEIEEYEEDWFEVVRLANDCLQYHVYDEYLDYDNYHKNFKKLLGICQYLLKTNKI